MARAPVYRPGGTLTEPGPHPELTAQGKGSHLIKKSRFTVIISFMSLLGIPS